MQQLELIPLNNVIKKSNDFVRNKLKFSNVIAGRVLASFASLIKVDDDDFYQYYISANNVLLNIGGKDYKELKEACDVLLTAIIEKKLNSKGGFQKYTLFSTIGYENGLIFASFHPDLKPFFLNLKSHFTQYNLSEFLILPSFYSQRLFEILKSWESCSEVIIPLHELHTMLNPPVSYKLNFKEFRRWVLEKAYKDINEKTSLCYEWEAIKTKNKVTAVNFIFSKGKKLQYANKKSKELTDKFIQSQARPGESWDEARARLSNITT